MLAGKLEYYTLLDLSYEFLWHQWILKTNSPINMLQKNFESRQQTEHITCLGTIFANRACKCIYQQSVLKALLF